jgi:integral membrane protein (TIGR00529 family)
MIVLVKVGLVLGLLLVLIRLKWDLGLVLFLDACLAAVLFGMRPLAFGHAVFYGTVSGETLKLAAIVVLVLYLGEFLQSSGAFRAMVGALKNLVRDDRLILAIPSAFIGRLPMMGGAMMGAPIVDEAARRWDVPPDWKTFYNYWFRHVWEYWWPLYLSVIMASAIFRVPVWKIGLYQALYSAVAIGAGLAVLFRKLPRLPREREGNGSWKDAALVVGSIWPIVLTIVLIFVFRLDMLIALAVAAVLTQVASRSDLKGRWAVVARSFSPRTVWLTVAVMVFKRVLEDSGALEAVVRAVPPHGASAYILLFAAPFVVGLLTGVNQAYVAIAFPLLVPIVGTGAPDMVLLTFAFVSGFAGILLSPAHLCLALTAEYFKADMRRVYRILIGPVAAVFGVALLELLIFRIL